MSLFDQILILTISLALLAKSASVVVQNLVKTANILRWSTFIVSFIALGLASSTPEFFVGINAALDNTPQLSLGNVIGASIVLLTLLTGLTALISGKVIVDSTFTNKDLIIMNGVIILPVVLLYDGSLDRIDSIIMFVAYLGYVLRIYKGRHKLSHPISKISNNHELQKSLVFLLLGFVGLAIASNFAVDSARAIAEFLNIPILLIGILVFSLGTNFPELIIALTAVRRRQKAIVIGNVLGSTATNTLVISIVSFISPFEIQDFNLFKLSVFFLIVAIASFSFFVKSKNEITRVEGFFLLSVYVFFILSEVVSKIV
jgi:cation:H+ antiporter